MHKKSRDLLFLERGLYFFFVWSSNVHTMNFHIKVVLWTFLSKSSIHSIHFAWEFFGSELQKMVWLFILLFCQKCIFLEIYVTLFKKVLQKRGINSIHFVFSMQIAKALGGGQQSSNDDQWEAFKEAQLGDTSKFTE